MNINSTKDLLAKEIIKMVASVSLLVITLVGIFSKETIFPKILLKILGIVISLVTLGFYI